MKKELKNKLIFISGVVFALALLFVSVQMIQAGWTAPTAPFPGGTVYPPIDTSPDKMNGGVVSYALREGSIELQGKKIDESTGAVVNGNGSVLRVPADRWIGAEGNYFVPKTNFGSNMNFFSAGSFNVNAFGLVLPNKETNLLSPQSGMVTYVPSLKKAQLYDGSNWVDIGSGSGSGDSFWTQTADGIQYGGGNVTIAPFTSGWFATGVQAAVNKNEKAFSFLAKIVNAANNPIPSSQRMSCDKSDTALDCPNSYYAKLASDGNVSDGDKKYDIWKKTEYICPATNPFGNTYFNYDQNKCCDAWSGEENTSQPLGCITVAPTTKTMTKEFMFETKPAGIQKGTLSVDNINAIDINLSDPQWSKTIEVEHSGGTQTMGGSYITGFQDCPTGYFVSGFRFGRNGSTLNFVLRCSKL